MGHYPFAYTHGESFARQASDWMADLFYETLPEAGFEIREEQIFMAFQLAKAVEEKKTMFAEAGVGTGKTLVYLLHAICYARYSGKPSVIACADESLIEQLMKPEGDIAKLEKHVGLKVDVRLGKSPGQYVCLNKLDEALLGDEDAELYEQISIGLPDFVSSRKALQSFYPYGDRRQYPDLDDTQWRRIAWDPFQDCNACEKRHRCGQTLSRDYYRKSSDLIVCSHDFYMEHVWTKERRKQEGQLPLLPAHGMVVFDEGHLLEFAAQRALSLNMSASVFEHTLSRLLEGNIREKLAFIIEESIGQCRLLFDCLESGSQAVEGSDKRAISRTEELLVPFRKLQALLEHLEEELAIESGLFSMSGYRMRVVEAHLEQTLQAIRLFLESDKAIAWTEQAPGGLTLSIMPGMVGELLGKRVFASDRPIVFSSATMSVGGRFDYLADSLGIGDYLSFSVPSPYDYEKQMLVIYPDSRYGTGEGSKLEQAAQLLRREEGGTLILFPSADEMRRFREGIPGFIDGNEVRFLYEGDGEISHLVGAFQRDERSVLCAVTLWEGLDVPGRSLQHVIVWALPFPPSDPLFNARRLLARAPWEEVDIPYMLLRLRQGIGRLIRSRDDQGTVALLDDRICGDTALRAIVDDVLPPGVAEMSLDRLPEKEG